MKATTRVCYMLNRYPSISHTFIQREIAAIRAAGVEVFPVALRPSAADQLLSDGDRAAFAETTTLRPISMGRLVTRLGRILLRHPAAFVETLLDALRSGGTDLRDVVWKAFYFGEALLLWQHCEDHGVRHIHAHFATAPSDLAMIASAFGNRVRNEGSDPWSWSLTVHGWHEFVAEGRHLLGRKVTAAEFVICISDYTRSQLMRQVAPTVWPRLHVRHCGVDPTVFVPRLEDSVPGRILCVGRLDAEKGHLVLLDAMALLRDRGVAATLVLAGAGPYDELIDERIVEHHLEGVVDRVGAVGQDGLAALYQSAEVFCLPTFIEGLPVVLMEAMSCGLPAVTTFVNGIPELVEDGRTGVVTSPGRPDLLADALQRLLADPDLRDSLGRAGRARVLDEFDINQLGPAIAALFATPPSASVSTASGNQPGS